MRRAHGLIVTTWFVSIAGTSTSAASAQIHYGTDVMWHSRYEWRGLTMRDGMVLQPDFYVSHGSRYSFTVGGWTNVELTAPPSTEFGYGTTLLGESNVWAEIAANFELVDVAAGWNWFRFDAQRRQRVPLGGFGTHELYARIRLPNLPVVVPQVAYFQDVDKGRGGFIESSLTMRVPLWNHVKVPVGSVLLTGATGYNVSQDSVGGVERFQDRGFKYAEFSASTVTGYLPVSPFNLIYANLAFTFAFHVQFNLDPTTERTLVGSRRTHETYWTIGLQWFGPRCEPTRRVC